MNAPLIADKLLAQSAAFIRASQERDEPQAQAYVCFNCKRGEIAHTLYGDRRCLHGRNTYWAPIPVEAK